MFVEDGELEIYDIMHAPENYTQFELESKLIFVAKKQKNNLERLIKLISKTCPDMINKRILIVDDEADSASIGFSRNRESGDIDATTIARQLSELRSHPDNISFLQVTATPYSLYLQPSNIEVGNVYDYKPTRPAFTQLVPVPDAYVGGETYFGDKARSDEPTVESLIHHTVDHDEFNRLRRRDRRSVREGKALQSNSIVGFRTAIINFIVGGCIQRINGIKAGKKPKKLRYSLLLHSEATRGAHTWQHTIAEEIKSEFSAECLARSEVFTDLVTESYNDLRRSLELNGDPIPSFDEVLAEVQNAVTKEYISITKVNSDEDVTSLLDSTGQLKLRSPLNIFIGGQVLDRGVTLANLIGFYYGRRPNRYQQDTVLQHSRMYGYRRADIGVTRFYTSHIIRNAMFNMEEFDTSLRTAIDAGGDKSVQFIRLANNGSIIPCNPNKILISNTHTMRPLKRMLPFGFQSGYETGKNGIEKTISRIDNSIEELCGFGNEKPVLVPLETALELLSQIKVTLVEEEDTPKFDWEAANAMLTHLSHLNQNPDEKGKVLLWAARDRNSARYASASSHAIFIETPDSPKTEGRIAMHHAIDSPILFLLRQNGLESKGWRDTPFYWPIIRAQRNTPISMFTSSTAD